MIDSYGVSDIGLSRLSNEDVWAQLPEENFFILADGMGGHNAGEVAASETVIELCKWIKSKKKKNPTPEQWEKLLKQGIEKANLHVHLEASKNAQYKGMGTTLCVALASENKLIIGHVGDSRIYRFRKGRLTRLTHDHSLKGELIASGELEESRADNFPYKNVITRAIGTQPSVKPDLKTLDIKTDDLYLLCSDGLSDPLSDDDIAEILSTTTTLKRAAESLVLAAKKARGGDNITLIIFKIDL